MTTIALQNIPHFITARGVDTLMITKLLRQLNFSEQQAEAVSEMVKQINIASEEIVREKIETHKKENDVNLNEIASKGDLLIAKKELELQIEKVRAEIANTKSDLIKWVAGLMIANTGLLFTLIKFFN